MTFVRNGSSQGAVGELLLHCVGKLGIRNLEYGIQYYYCPGRLRFLLENSLQSRPPSRW